ncbi:MAG: serine/threonine protein kinase, partial [bacterium]|nr:serine/threonine protein kinase [bacterium]
MQNGEVLAERFEVVRFVAQGGMGEVYEVEDLELGAHVALKTLRTDLIQDPIAIERLKREVQLARQVTHRNVCRLFDLIHHRPTQHEGIKREVTGLTMELIHGETLSARLARGGRMAPRDALPLIRQMAAGLAAAHAVDVVHRDFKSANIMLEPDASGNSGFRAVITDFGLARTGLGETKSTQLTERNLVVGTADYMAPEQAQGGKITPACDIYALGVVIFEMVTGARPHSGSTAVELLLKRVQEDAPSPRTVVPDLDMGWDDVIRRCLATDPSDRYRSAMDVVAALETASGSVSVSALRQTATIA